MINSESIKITPMRSFSDVNEFKIRKLTRSCSGKVNNDSSKMVTLRTYNRCKSKSTISQTESPKLLSPNLKLRSGNRLNINSSDTVLPVIKVKTIQYSPKSHVKVSHSKQINCEPANVRISAKRFTRSGSLTSDSDATITLKAIKKLNLDNKQTVVPTSSQQTNNNKKNVIAIKKKEIVTTHSIDLKPKSGSINNSKEIFNNFTESDLKATQSTDASKINSLHPNVNENCPPNFRVVISPLKLNENRNTENILEKAMRSSKILDSDETEYSPPRRPFTQNTSSPQSKTNSHLNNHLDNINMTILKPPQLKLKYKTLPNLSPTEKSGTSSYDLDTDIEDIDMNILKPPTLQFRPTDTAQKTKKTGTPSDDLTSLSWLQSLDMVSMVPHIATPPTPPASPPGLSKDHKRKLDDENCNAKIDLVDYSKDGSRKPPYSYAALIGMAMKANGNKMTLSAIYSWIKEHFIYYKTADPSWQVCC